MAEHTDGKVAGIFIAALAGTMPAGVPRALAVAGRGLDGDRYGSGTGTWSDRPGGGRQLTLIAQEDLDEVGRVHGIRIDAAASRRNVLTTGIDLRSLVGQRFRVGQALCLGIRLCEPCSYLEEKTQPGVLRAFLHRAGLRADILEGGEIAVGDPIRGAGEASP
ncbi:MAG: MOSC domain-containing protein [Armatimonadota bacterium]|nr:MOSC domain-containing protein [Armatimonadota bacterium]MDR7534312.1 MOSC domain-containing protein [Armatimonadota bacterium]MDR7535924.1 MOSC domain-containing protein [Armatimonadota bacterium]